MRLHFGVFSIFSLAVLLHACVTRAKPQSILSNPNPQAKVGRLAGHPLNFPSTGEPIATTLEPLQADPIHPFQVAVPLVVPKTQSCTVNIVEHEFAFSYGKPYVGTYTPPKEDKCAGPWSKVVLDLTGTSQGRQYDRLAALYIGGAEILRTSTPEPTYSGIDWNVQKDVTAYSSLLSSPQTVVFDLPNLVSDTLNGTYVISINLLFYAAEDDDAHAAAVLDVPDLIIPISASSNSSGWFSLQSFNDVAARNVTFPRNLVRAVVEVYANGQINDEFWYTNPPNDYIELLNQTGTGNGAYREVLVYIDQILVGATITYPVIFSGGILPTFWRPVLDYTALNILSYYIDVTPFVGMLVDGKPHTISLRVANANSFWLVDANLHLWVDHGTNQTIGGLIKYEIEPNATIAVVEQIESNLDANFTTTVKRAISLVGWVRTSTHQIRSTVHRLIRFNNKQQFTNESNSESWSQKIIQATTIVTSTQALKHSGRPRRKFFHIQTTSDEWPFSGSNSYVATADGGFILSGSIDQGFRRQTLDQRGARVVFASEVSEKQTGSGAYGQTGKGLPIGGLGPTTLNTKLDYFDSTKRCYKREVAVNNTVIISDEESEKCLEKKQ